ncbi:MAG: tetratricopeptide repeat protein [Pyrinomonadaceae bacterium]|nr:tetratricopeptide repeat protein [Pyrinomonadaceae bacterium]
MRYFGLLFLILLTFTAVFAQDESSGETNEEKTPVVEQPSDKDVYEAAIAIENPGERASALKKFLADYPESELRNRAFESLSSVRAIIADAKVRNNEIDEGIRLFKLAVSEAPDPISDRLFSKVLVSIPTNLFLLNQRNAAFDIAEMLEVRSAGNYKHLLGVATFYVGIKYATGARKIAEKAIEMKPDGSLGYQTLGLASRLGFDMQGAESAYEKALEFSPESLGIRQSLGELKRALGKPAEAEALFEFIIEKEPGDIQARTGLILSLFDQGRRKEAEAKLVEELNENPTNADVMIGAANWYAANGEAQLAVDHGTQAVSVMETNVWGYIILARGFMALGRPADAERILVAASRLGAGASHSYELALAQIEQGFYSDASEVISKHFRLEGGKVVTDLDGRIGAEADTFFDLVALERKSAIFSPHSSYDTKADKELRALFEFKQLTENEDPGEEVVGAATDAFVNGTDETTAFRQLYAAEVLLEKNLLPAKAASLAGGAVESVDTALESEGSASAVLADQLYAGRRDAASVGRVVVVPPVESSVLSQIMRGRIEDITARAFIAQEDLSGAEIRLKRAISILPKDSAWWRKSMWRLGMVYEKQGKEKEALNSYASSYVAGEPTDLKRGEIEKLYSKLNGSTEGLDVLLDSAKTSKTDTKSVFVKTNAPNEGTKPESDEKSVDGAVVPDLGNEKPKEGVIPDENPMELELKPVDAKPTQKKVLAEDLDLNLVTVPATKADSKTVPETTSKNGNKKSGDVENSEKPVDKASTADSTIKDSTADVPVEKVAEGAEKPKETGDTTDVKKSEAESMTGAVNPKDVRKVDEKPVEKVSKPLIDLPPETAEPVTTQDREVADLNSPKKEESTPEKPGDQPGTDSDDLTTKTVSDGQSNDKRQTGNSETNLSDRSNSSEKPGNKVGAEGNRREAELIDLGARRPRIVPAEKIREVVDPNACRIVVSQDTVSMIANGGSFGIVVGLDNYEKAYVLRAESLAPEDISIVYEPEIGSVDGRAFFVIRSISEKTGEFEVKFETPCGIKKVGVKVH